MGKLVPHYLTGTITVAANVMDSLNVQTAGHRYWIRGLLARSTGTFTLQVTPTDTNKQLFSAAIDSRLVTGVAQGTDAAGVFRIDGGAGVKHFTPLAIDKSTTIIIEVTDTSSSSNTITVVLDGYRYEA